MSAHRLLADLHQSPFTVTDPGTGNTITIDRDFAAVPLVSTTTETRTLARPTKAGVECYLYVKTYVGAITLTVTGGFNTNGSTTFVFGAAAQWAKFVSAYDGTNYYWNLEASSVLGNLAALQRTPVTAITTLTVTAALHAGRTVLLSLATGFASTLPAATGTGNKYRFIINIIPTTTSTYTIVTVGSDVLKGTAAITVPGSTWATAAKGESFATSAGTTITIGGTNSPSGGATIGDFVELEDIATNVWQTFAWLTAATTPSTPFS